MANILIIQPYKMLRQALAVALGFEHQIKFMETVPIGSALEEFDAMVVDAAELAEGNLQEVKNCKIPTVWIENGASSAPPKREKVVAIALPIQRDKLKDAVLRCLSASSRGTSGKAVTVQLAAPSMEVANHNQTQSGRVVDQQPRVVELTDVVDEAQMSNDNKIANIKK